MRAPRLLLALLAIVVVFACARAASSGASSAAEIAFYDIRNDNWNAANVFIVCGDGHVIKRIRQIPMGRPERGEIDISTCTDPRFVVNLIGSQDAYASDTITGWTPGSTLYIDIMSYLPLTSFRVGFTRQS